MDYSKVEKFIKENADADDFTGGISEGIISELEEKLQLNFPTSYKWFLKNYGSGGMYGIEVLGFVNGKATVVDQTKDYRRYFNLPKGPAMPRPFAWWKTAINHY
ncbi:MULTISPECIES: SMI1/KNR4 family protein [Bacillus]|uniref:SMI1/KNR4 family protein n=1 Tax=Bacillus TaxID=1386 RepID=UPI0015843A43|nr:SMI1/KNR4 family protein [Bacillus glycinifermentans]MBU8785261.1 SMI1/KNR4 family protein [Bacillus glycinifermentans]NUJ15431.1 SMI1/KNR4 family protein [Bacillus glycinifermentans]